MLADPETQAGPDWDVTAAVLDALLADATRPIALLMTADGCSGCDQLAGQLAGQAAALEAVELLTLKIGDLGQSQIRVLRIGGATLTTPGFPVIWLLEPTGPRSVDLVAISLGPLDAWRVEEDLATLLRGESRWVAEAGLVALEICVGGICLSLNATNDFQQRVSLPLPD